MMCIELHSDFWHVSRGGILVLLPSITCEASTLVTDMHNCGLYSARQPAHFK